MKVGIRDVARAAGVSTATVSRALGRGPVSEALREQVEAAVRATGYRPNLSARRLRSQATRTIGLIVADIRNPFFTAVSRAVEDAAFGADMRVILCNTDEDPAREAMYLRLMEEERVTGVIFAPTVATTAGLGEREFDFPVVLIDRVGPPGAYDSVVLDNVAACSDLVDHLAGNGYRQIGGFFGSTSSTAHERRAGYEAAMRRHGLTPEIRTLAPNAFAVAAELVAVAGRINNAVRRLGSGWSIFVEAQRSEAATYPASQFPDAASALVDAERKAGFEEAGTHFVSGYFLTFLWLPPAEDAARADEMFSILMGEDVDQRRSFIQRNAKDVRFLDI